MYDPRIVMDMVYRYGRAVAARDLAQVGLLYSQIARAIEHGHDETALPSEEDRAVEVAAAR